MAEPFEIWAPRQIARHRSEAETLERALASYLASNGSGRSENGGVLPICSQAVGATSSVHRTSKHFGILDALERAQSAGLTSDEMSDAAVAAGAPISRNNLRSYIWTNKKNGKFVAVDKDRVALAKFAPADPTSSPNGETGGWQPPASLT